MKAESVREFLTRVEEVREAFEFEQDDVWKPWFRGQQRHYWRLNPKLYRDYGGFDNVKNLRFLHASGHRGGRGTDGGLFQVQRAAWRET